MDPREALHRLGGVAPYAALSRLSGRRSIERAVRVGDVLRDGRDCYSLPEAGAALRTAVALKGVVSHASAALHWGWEVKTVPRLPHITVARNRNLGPELRAAARVHWAALRPQDVVDRVTSPGRTLVDCMRSLPRDEAVAIADSALRHQVIGSRDLARIAAAMTGPGAGAARAVASIADGRAANPFESVLRTIASDVPHLALVPQYPVRHDDFAAQPDLVDPRLRIVVEADSQTWHNANRAQLRRDCQRYTALTSRGWLVARFAWEDVMFEAPYVRNELSLVTERARERA